MTNKLLLAWCLSLAMFACSKNDDNSNNAEGHIAASQLPAPVMSAFNTRYPSASGQIEWEIEQGTTYKVKFLIGSHRWQASLPPAELL